MADLHDKKSHDYASNENPYGNYHFAGKLALLFAHSEQDAGFIGRLGEKFYRLANLESSKKAASNESIDDTELDICVITLLWMADRRDRRQLKDRNQYSQMDIESEIIKLGSIMDDRCLANNASYLKELLEFRQRTRNEKC